MTDKPALLKTEQTYLALLLLPQSMLRVRLQPELAACRDALAFVADKNAEEVQSDFEGMAADLLAALSRPAPAAEVTDLETSQTLLDLLNPLHGSLDEQTYDDKMRAEFDTPPDAEYAVNVTAQQERDLTQAVLILEDRKRQATVVAAAEVTGARLAFPDGIEIADFKPCVIENRELGLTTYIHEDVAYVAHPLTAPDGTRAHYVDALLAMDDDRLVGVNFWRALAASPTPDEVKG